MRKKIEKRVFAIILSLVMVVTSISLPQNVIETDAATALSDTFFIGSDDDDEVRGSYYKMSMGNATDGTNRVYTNKYFGFEKLKSGYIEFEEKSNVTGYEISQIVFFVNAISGSLSVSCTDGTCTNNESNIVVTGFSNKTSTTVNFSGNGNSTIKFTDVVVTYSHNPHSWSYSSNNDNKTHSKTCTVCDSTVSSENCTDNGSGKCTYCSQSLAFNVTLNANGGSASATTLKCTPGGTYTGLDSITPTRTGYTFDGWYNPGNAKVTASSTLYSNSAHTLTAHWNANTYSIDYNLNDGTLTSSKPTSATYDTSVTVGNPTKSGCTFDGWTITGMDSCTHTYGTATTSATSLSNCKETSYKNLRSTSGTVTFTANWTHNHVWSYVANGNKITSSCSADNCNISDKTATIELKTKDEIKYTGITVSKSDIFSATDFTTFNNATGCTNLSADDVKIYAVDSDGNKTGSELTGTILTIGNYIAELTCNGATATQAFEVKKANPTITVLPKAVEGLIYNGNPQILITNTGVDDSIQGGTIKYSLSEDGEYATSLPTGTNADDYTVYYKIFGDANHEDTTATAISVSIAKSSQTIATPTVKSKNEVGIGSVTLDADAIVAGQGATKFAVSENDVAPSEGWQDSPTFSGLTYNKDYYFFAKYVGNDNYEPVVSSSVSEKVVDTTKPTATIKFETKSWTSFLNTITFGLLFKNTKKATIEASDGGSGIDTIQYYITDSAVTSEEALAAITKWTNYNEKGVSFNPTGKYIVYFKVVDKAGNILYLNSDGIEIDDTAPVITGLVSDKTYTNESGSTEFVVEDFDIASVTADGEVLAATSSTTVSDITKNTYTLGQGSYTEVVVKDAVGNTTTVKNVTVKTGWNKPVLNDTGKDNKTYVPGNNYTITDESVSPSVTIGTYTYDEDEPGQAEFSYDDSTYELFENTEDTTENIDSPATIDTGRTYYIRKKAGTGIDASDLVPLTISKLDTSTVSVNTSDKEMGSVGFSEDSASDSLVSKTVYTGQTVSITATEKTGYKFIKWVDKSTGEAYQDDATAATNPLSITATGNMYLVAIFEIDAENVVSIPDIFATAKNFTYDGSLKTALASPLEDTGYTMTGDNTATNAGVYKFTLKLDADKIWGDGTTEDKTYTWSILKGNVPDAEVSALKLTLSSAYDETNKTITIPSPASDYEIMYGWNGPISEFTSDTSEAYNSGENYGTYYVRKKETNNIYPSAWIPVTAGYDTINIDKGVPISITDTTVTIFAKLGSLDGIEGEKIWYRKSGTDDWTNKVEINPVTVNISEKLTGLDPNTEYEYYIEATDGKNTFKSDIGEFKTEEKSVAETGEISCKVDNESGATTTAVVTIEEGNVVLATKTVSIANGNTEIVGPFSKLEDGVYNIVLRTIDGNFTETRSITIENGEAKVAGFEIMPGKLSTTVEIKDNAPRVAVDGLENLISASEIQDVKDGKKSVDVTLCVAKKDELSDGSEKEAMEELVSYGGKIDSILDFSLTKTTVNIDNVTQNVTSIESDNIGATNTEVLEIAIPYKKSVKQMLRYHNGVAQELTSLSARQSDGYVDGTYFVGDNYIYLYASGFSTYAIVTYEATSVKIVTPSTTELTNKNQTLQLSAVIAPEETSDKSLTWTSSDTSVATVDENGLVTAVGEGSTTITVTTVNGLTDTITITVKFPPEKNKDDENTGGTDGGSDIDENTDNTGNTGGTAGDSNIGVNTGVVNTTSTSPKTGDSFTEMVMILLMMAGLGLVSISNLYAKRKRR